MTFTGSLRTSLFIPRTSVFVRVFQTLEVTIFGSRRTSRPIPRTSVFVQIFQTFEVTIIGNPFRTSLFIPRTSVFVQIFQTLEVTIFGSLKQVYSFQGHRFRANISNTRGDHFGQRKNKYVIPRTSVFVRVFQTLEVTIFGSRSTSPFFIPRTSVFVRVFQTLEVTIFAQ